MMKSIKNTMKVGVGSMVGIGVIGAMSSLPNMPVQAKSAGNLAATGLILANIGQLANTASRLGNNVSKYQSKIKSKKW